MVALCVCVCVQMTEMVPEDARLPLIQRNRDKIPRSADYDGISGILKQVEIHEGERGGCGL